VAEFWSSSRVATRSPKSFHDLYSFTTVLGLAATAAMFVADPARLVAVAHPVRRPMISLFPVPAGFHEGNIIIILEDFDLFPNLARKRQQKELRDKSSPIQNNTPGESAHRGSCGGSGDIHPHNCRSSERY
jgi:hypothetical protein